MKRVRRLLVKICGLQTTEQAIAAETYGADLLGFIMAPSRRQLTPAKARMICRRITKAERVGVFVDAPLALVREMAAYCGFDRVQLHGSETAAYCEAIGLPYIKTLVMDKPLPTVAELEAFYNGCFLIDSGSGSGIAFDWRRCGELPEAVQRKMLLAGGLDAGNVCQAIQTVNPLGVDVSSGVETNGMKDLRKIAAFIGNVREQGGKSNAGCYFSG